MAEIYAHERLAFLAAEGAELEPYVYAQQPAYLLGASGPDVLFFHYCWRFGNRYKLPSLGFLMHKARTNAFFEALFLRASTNAQRAYALGFLCHYALDHCVHPYVYAQCEKGRPFAMKGGHGFLEIAIDSTFYLIDTPVRALNRRLTMAAAT